MTRGIRQVTAVAQALGIHPISVIFIVSLAVTVLVVTYR